MFLSPTEVVAIFVYLTSFGIIVGLVIGSLIAFSGRSR